MQVRVDAARCFGHARCWAACPEVFVLDDDSVAHAVSEDVPSGLEDKVRAAAAGCPEKAIILEFDDARSLT